MGSGDIDISTWLLFDKTCFIDEALIIINIYMTFHFTSEETFKSKQHPDIKMEPQPLNKTQVKK